MKHLLSRVLSLFLVLSLILSGMDLTVYAADSAAFTILVTGSYKQTDARSMLSMVNDLRTGDNAWYINEDNSSKTYCKDLKALVYDYSLEEIAMQRAMEIAIYYSHTRPNGKDITSAFSEFSYSWSAIGENIAAGYTSVSDMFKGWAEEKENYAGQGHRRNMLSNNFTRIGIACVSVDGYLFWVQEFSNGNGSTTKTTANDSATDKQISILASNATITMTASPASVTIEPDKSASLPQITASLTTPEIFPSGRKRVIKPVGDYNYSSSDTSIFTINAGAKTLTGVKDGSCKLLVSAFNKSLEVPVTVKSHTHSYTSKVTAAATCSKEGVKTYTCSECGDSYTEAIPKTAHTKASAVRENETASTCTKTGSYDSVVYCSVCKTELERSTVNLPLASHTEGKAVRENEKAATCTKDGSFDSVIYCSVCKTELKRSSNTVKATGHTYESKTSDSTCTAEGKTTYTCKNCGDSYDETIPAKGHTEGKSVKENEKAATCTKDGSYDIVVRCTVCNTVISQKTTKVPATGHNYESKISDGSCTTGGKVTYTCKNCGDSYDETIPAKGHTEGKSVKENEKAATCTVDGSYDMVIRCTVCNEVISKKTTKIPASGHTEGKAVKEKEKNATCTASGSYDSVIYCTSCGTELKRTTTTIAATGHSYESKVTNGSCTTGGRVTYTCKVCGDSYTETLAATGHTEAKAVKENEKKATCTTDGSYDSVVYCQVCHEKLSSKKVTISATGHSYVETITPPTTENAGFTTFTCTNCGDSYTGNYTDSLTVDLSNLNAKLSYTITTYSGKYKKPSVTILDGEKELLKDTDFTVSYKNYKNPGIATVTIEGIGSYSGTIKKTFKIRPKEAEITSVTNLSTGSKVSWDEVYGASGYYIYRKTGSEDFKKIKTISDGSLSYTDTAAKTNGKKYSYKIIAYKTKNSTTIKAKDSNVFVSYYISRLSFTALKADSGKFTASWEKNAKANGYQLQYSKSSSFSTRTTKTITDPDTLKKSVSSLKKGSTYYVRIRAYKTVNGKKFYSAWTAKKSVVIK